MILNANDNTMYMQKQNKPPECILNSFVSDCTDLCQNGTFYLTHGLFIDTNERFCKYCMP
jgi:hypothetical protein